MVALRHLLHLRSRISHREEMTPVAPGLLKEILLENVRLKGRSGFARDDEKRLLYIDLRLNISNLRRVRRIEHVHVRKSWLISERKLQNFDTKARSTHTEQQRIGETSP